MIYKGVKYELFGGVGEDEYNAMLGAFSENAGGVDSIYEWLEKTPKTTMIVNLVDKLHEMGFKIIN